MSCTMNNTQKMKFSIKDFFNKHEQICKKLWIWSHLLKILNGKLFFLSSGRQQKIKTIII